MRTRTKTKPRTPIYISKRKSKATCLVKNYCTKKNIVFTVLAIATILTVLRIQKDLDVDADAGKKDQQVNVDVPKDVDSKSSRHNSDSNTRKLQDKVGVLAWDSSMIKTHSSEKGWKIVDWQNAITQEEEEKFSCQFTEFKSASTGKSAQMCVHTFFDYVSSSIRRKKRWADCDPLPTIWNGLSSAATHNEKSVYVEIGANIGSCVMEMLLGTDANIIAFEPHPMNLFNLKKTVSQLDPSLQKRLRLIPVGLGHEQGSSTIYSARNNMGNSVIGKIIKDYEKQGFDEKLQFTIQVERLDSILNSDDIDVKLMKLDAQGFECNILEGMGNDVANAIGAIKFEWAAKWLNAQNCTDFLPRLRNYGFDVYKKYTGESRFSNLIETDPEGAKLYTDLYATRLQKTN